MYLYSNNKSNSKIAFFSYNHGLWIYLTCTYIGLKKAIKTQNLENWIYLHNMIKINDIKMTILPCNW